MTVATSFFNWQTSGLDPLASPYEQKSPNLVALDDYLLDRWGGQVVGGHRNRDIGSSGKWSTHAYGAASDWRYEAVTNGNREPGRIITVSEIIPWLIDWSHELGIDAIHDYVGSRIWRAGRTSSPDPNDWWKHSDGDAMGEAWAQWLHTETHRDSFMWSTPIDQRLVSQSTPPPISTEEDDMTRWLVARTSDTGDRFLASPGPRRGAYHVESEVQRNYPFAASDDGMAFALTADGDGKLVSNWGGVPRIPEAAALRYMGKEV